MALQKRNIPYIGEVLLGHVRYGTFGKNSVESVHPFLRQNNWQHRNLIMAGNFNMTNVKELFNNLIELGQHQKDCLLYTSPSPRDRQKSRMPSSA